MRDEVGLRVRAPRKWSGNEVTEEARAGARKCRGPWDSPADVPVGPGCGAGGLTEGTGCPACVSRFSGPRWRLRRARARRAGDSQGLAAWVLAPPPDGDGDRDGDRVCSRESGAPWGTWKASLEQHGQGTAAMGVPLGAQVTVKPRVECTRPLPGHPHCHPALAPSSGPRCGTPSVSTRSSCG